MHTVIRRFSHVCDFRDSITPEFTKIARSVWQSTPPSTRTETKHLSRIIAWRRQVGRSQRSRSISVLNGSNLMFHIIDSQVAGCIFQPGICEKRISQKKHKNASNSRWSGLRLVSDCRWCCGVVHGQPTGFEIRQSGFDS